MEILARKFQLTNQEHQQLLNENVVINRLVHKKKRSQVRRIREREQSRFKSKLQQKERRLREDLIAVFQERRAEAESGRFDSNFLDSDAHWRERERASNLQHSFQRVRDQVDRRGPKEVNTVSGVVAHKNDDDEISGFYVNYHHSPSGSGASDSPSHRRIERRLEEMTERMPLQAQAQSREPQAQEVDRNLFTLRKKSTLEISRLKESRPGGEKKSAHRSREASAKRSRLQKSKMSKQTRRSHVSGKSRKASVSGKSARASVPRKSARASLSRKSGVRAKKPRHRKSAVRKRRFSSEEASKGESVDSFSSDSEDRERRPKAPRRKAKKPRKSFIEKFPNLF